MDTFYSLNAQVKATLATSELNTTEYRVDTNILLKIVHFNIRSDFGFLKYYIKFGDPAFSFLSSSSWLLVNWQVSFFS